MLKVKKIKTNHPHYIFYRGSNGEERGRAMKVPNIPDEDMPWLVWHWHGYEQRDVWFHTQMEAYDFIKLGWGVKLNIEHPNIKQDYYQFFHEKELVGTVYRRSWGRWYATNTTSPHLPNKRFGNKNKAFAYIRDGFEQRQIEEKKQ